MAIIVGSAMQRTTAIINPLANYRYQVIVKQLGWNLDTFEGLELDQFDRSDTYYVVVRNLQQDIIGCARLLPITQPYLLKTIIPQLLNGLPPPKTDEIWELSRFAAVVQLAQEQGSKRLLLISFFKRGKTLALCGIQRTSGRRTATPGWKIDCCVLG